MKLIIVLLSIGMFSGVFLGILFGVAQDEIWANERLIGEDASAQPRATAMWYNQIYSFLASGLCLVAIIGITVREGRLSGTSLKEEA